ncbi:MAG: phosphate ABC transporter, permease protein PstA [Lentisphaerae bacterium RIFOXYC12_FULL_60_16]|nr:MAG: phosphate ABC transporter, permease protein PstA [Lentisphaerae bacterium RIFOXYC12_FULL_60_16]OGV75051.1 MAG: phosphate ABC transporter, permease protein PstA [Lentisphaerae bacterium RIFOXYA12_FULL_60_10]OGV77958.1 MAG: phosphate ABC transporter, permease protein PstA [Lentisphaerae bacterium RIFOXYB12_FULL_60_10]
MELSTRKTLDRAFSGTGMFSICLMTASLLVILLPVFAKGIKAFVFRETIENRKMILEQFHRGDSAALDIEWESARTARQPVYDAMQAFRIELDTLEGSRRRELRSSFREVESALQSLLGPEPGSTLSPLLRNRYGQTRWDRAQVKLQQVLFREAWDYSRPGEAGTRQWIPRKQTFAGTRLEPMFDHLETKLDSMLQPRWTFYWRFLSDDSRDSHLFGGIWPEVLGTLYLTIGAMLFAVPMGVIAAIYLTEYARPGRVVQILRTCISTLAGVPSIVFGLFGLAFFINTLQVSSSKSVLAGSMTLALLILPTIIRASEEAILAVPRTYKEAALSLGSGTWNMILTVLLPAALPGILTGIVISMGRAAGETAPIIFTAAVSVGKPLTLLQTLTQPTPALPWNIYNLATEHAAVEEIRHVQFGMVLTLVVMVLILNATAIAIRARIARRMKG